MTTVNNRGSAETWPKLRVRGFGRLYYLENATTGSIVYFDELIINSGEYVTLDFTPGNISLISNTRGSLISSVLPGSDLAGFKLVPGNNNINLMFHAQGAPDEAALFWRERSHGVEAALQ
jgi:hypothetical protein